MENRIIKFRAFKDGKMYPVHTLDMYPYQDGKLAGFSHFSYPNEKECINLDGAVFMQYTGLKDNNDIEIYEGDVVMFLDRDWMDYEKDTKRLPVVYQNDSFIIKGGEDKYGQYYEYPLFRSYGRDRFEVIGNIYQHPHLLNQQS